MFTLWARAGAGNDTGNDTGTGTCNDNAYCGCLWRWTLEYGMTWGTGVGLRDGWVVLILRVCMHICLFVWGVDMIINMGMDND